MKMFRPLESSLVQKMEKGLKRMKKVKRQENRIRPNEGKVRNV